MENAVFEGYRRDSTVFMQKFAITELIKSLTSNSQSDIIKIGDSFTDDGALIVNKNAAGPYSKRMSSAEKAKYNRHIVGKTTSDGVTVELFTEHAFDRIAQRKISSKRIENMLKTSNITPSKTNGNCKCYDIKGSRLVLDTNTGAIVTVAWRK